MSSLSADAGVFRTDKVRQAAEARQRAALQLACGLDLDALSAADAPARRAALGRVERALERERLKAALSHWSYDLNRHIALAEARNALRGDAAEIGRRGNAGKQNGARRRRPGILPAAGT